MPDNYIIQNGELYHYGVKGMKWGVRKKTYDTVVEKRNAYRQANKEYNKSFNKAYNRNMGSFSPIKKHRVNSKKRWDDAYDKGQAAEKARKEFKDAQKAMRAERKTFKQESSNNYKQAKQEFRSDRKNVSKSRSMGAKIATNILAGPFANRTYNSVIAAGGTKTKARVITGVTNIVGGPLGHLAVSALYTSSNAEKRVK